MIDYVLGDAAGDQMQQTSPTVCGHGDHIGSHIVRKFKDSRLFRQRVIDFRFDILKPVFVHESSDTGDALPCSLKISRSIDNYKIELGIEYRLHAFDPYCHLIVRLSRSEEHTSELQ